MNQTTVELIQGFIALAGTIALAALAWAHRRQPPAPATAEEPEAPRPTPSLVQRLQVPVLIVLAIVSLASYPRFGRFHFPTFVHNWDMFHYYLGARYFGELGYTDLYRCTLEADREIGGRLRAIRQVRDLETLRVVRADRYLRQGGEHACRERFAPARWEAFTRDLRYFHTITPMSAWRRMLVDKGYNGTPAWTVPVAALADWADGDAARITAIAAIDEVLVLAALGCVLWAFGLRAFLLGAFFVGINFATRFQHLGGSILRLDWMACLIVSLCCIKKDRWALAGVSLGYAAMARLFPILFAFGVAVRAAVVLFGERRLDRRALRFVAALCVTMAALGALGATTPRGFAAWSEFARDIGPHSDSMATKRIGLKYALLMPAWLQTPADRSWERAMDARWRRIEPTAWALGALALLLLALGLRRVDDYEAFALGIIPVFFLLAPTRYYWGCLVVPFIVWSAFRRPWEPTVATLLVGMQAFLFLVTATRAPDTMWTSTVSSVTLALIFSYVVLTLSWTDLERAAERLRQWVAREPAG